VEFHGIAVKPRLNDDHESPGGRGVREYTCLITLLLRLYAAIPPVFTSATIVLSPGIALKLKLVTKTFVTRQQACQETDGFGKLKKLHPGRVSLF